MSLSGKVAFITGGAQGLGRYFAEALLGRNAKVFLADVKESVGRQTEQELGSKYGKSSVAFSTCDVTSSQQYEDCLKTAVSTFGGVDILVNNAGIADEGPNWVKTIDVDLTAVIRGTKLGFEQMRKDKGGRGGVIINVASTAGVFPAPGMPVYGAAKFGVVGFTRHAAMTFPVEKYGVKMSCICPGAADTHMLRVQMPELQRKYTDLTPGITEIFKTHEKLGGVMKPEKVADAFMYVVGDERNHGGVLTIQPMGMDYMHPKRLQGKI